MRVNLSVLSRANWSRPGASRRQVGQWGAQNHSTMGRSDGAKLARFTVAPVATFTTCTEGRSESGSGVGAGVGSGVDSGVGGGVGSGVCTGVGTGVETGVGSGACVAAGAEVAAGSGVSAGSEVVAASVDLVVGVSSDSGSPGEAPMLPASGVGSAGAAASVESGSGEGWSGAWMLVGAAVGSDSIGVTSVTEVSDPPQAAATRVRARAVAAMATTLDLPWERNVRMLTS